MPRSARSQIETGAQDVPKLPSQNLTAAFCRSARPRTRETAEGTVSVQTEYRDFDVRGLALRVSPSGRKSWTYRYRDRITGAQSRIHIGLFDPTTDTEPDDEGICALTLHGARVAARKLRAQIDAGRNPAVERRRVRETARSQPIKSMKDLAQVYFAACESGTHRSGRGRKKAPSTLTAERWLWAKHLEPRLGSDLVEHVTRSRVRLLLREIFEASGGQANRARALLSQMFNFAIGEERLVLNPVTHVARVSEVSARTRTLTNDEMKAFWAALQNSDALVIRDKKAGDKVLISRSVRIAIGLALFTLQRRGEIAGMHRDELDLERKTWLIPAERTKGRSEHLVPLSDQAVVLIKEALQLQDARRKGASGFVFPSPHTNDAAIEAAALSHAMADLTAALDLDDVRLHDLRRTGATGIAALGVPPYIVSKVLAHKDGGGGAAITARHYNLYAYAAEKRDALDRWSAHLKALLQIEPPASRPARPTAPERLWTDLVDHPEAGSGATGTERLWTDLVEA
ncbi:tyrosine-type recombinase/integrase [Phenylobacterium sp.]|uniref:tyrosine-type recombinase/integrase n=1 Tax=Phenylobacterium sp. TaxID=1871053 RepID=UPI003BAB66F3